MRSCNECGGEIKETTSMLKRKSPFGKVVRVLNFPTEECGCKNKHTPAYSVYHLLIVDDYIREMKEFKDIVDFSDVEPKYKGITTDDILKKYLNETI